MSAFTRPVRSPLATLIAEANGAADERLFEMGRALWADIAAAAARADSMARLESALALAGGLLTHPVEASP